MATQAVDPSIISQLQRACLDRVHNSSRIEYKKGQALFYEGHTPCGALLLHSGEVELYQDDKEGKSKLIGHLPLLYVIGVDLILAELSYPFTAIAKRNSLISFIPKDEIRKYLTKFKKLSS